MDENLCKITDQQGFQTALKCNNCENYLNVSPIVYTKKEGNICGRCYPKMELKWPIIQHLYESIIRFMSFPCIYKNYGCVEELTYGDVTAHEKFCRYKPLYCPLSHSKLLGIKESCTWTGNSTALSDHLKTHQKLFRYPPVIEYSGALKDLLFFTTIGNRPVIVVIKHRVAKKYVFSVMVIGDLDSQCFKYELELWNEDMTNSFLLRKNRLEGWVTFPEHINDGDNCLEVDFDQISTILKNPKKIIVKYGIVKKNKKEILQITKNQDSTSENSQKGNKNVTVDMDLLRDLECPICNEYMFPPIYMCITGHSICHLCKTKIATCPVCRCKMGGRCFVLEKLVTKVKLPCTNKELGCMFVGNFDDIKEHEISCNFCEHYCLLRCGWTGIIANFYDHVLNNHSENIWKADSYQELDYDSDYNIFVCALGEVFYFRQRSHGDVWFNIEHVGAQNESKKSDYKYKIQISESVSSDKSLTFANKCPKWHKDDNWVNKIVMTEDLLDVYSNEESYYYIKISIAKM